MAVNNFRPHVIILPEDSANRQIANGFLLPLTSTQVKIEKEIGGWLKVVNSIDNNYAGSMKRFTNRYLILIVDCDKDNKRISDIRSKLPGDIADRIFILGCLSEPEELKKAGLGSYESIGRRIAEECRMNSSDIWQHDLLKNNLEEVMRIRSSICLFLIPS